jgi:glucokinase
MKNMKQVVALDVGGTKVGAGVVGTNRSITPSDPCLVSIRQDGTVEEIFSTVVDIVNRIRGEVKELYGIGIAMPGAFDYEVGISWMEHKFARLYGVNIKKLFENQFGLPVYFVNDAEAFALGAYWRSESSVQRMLGITLGTGLGACFLVNGEAVRSGPEIPEGGEIWNISWKGGILEDFISRRAIEALYAKEKIDDPRLPALKNVKEIADAAREGNRAARNAFLIFGENLGQGLMQHVIRFRPEAIVVGGQIAKAFDLFGIQAQKILKQQSGLDVLIMQSPLGDATAIAGAGFHCLRKLGFLKK